MRILCRGAVLVASLAIGTPVGAATIWLELPDAGDLPSSAQVTFGTGSLAGIVGRLSRPAFNGDVGDPFDVDLFSIYIQDPAGFSASTIADPFFVADPELYLFDAFGHAVAMNDDGDSPPQASLHGGSLGLTAGYYYLGIGFFDNQPLDALSNLLFDPLTHVPVGALAVAGWNAQVSLPNVDVSFDYEIALSGAGPAAPEPGTIVLLATGVALAAWRRRPPSPVNRAPGS